MALTGITLSDFRNHAHTRMDDAGPANLLIGPNGAGKTNFLEALSLLAPGRGMRRAPLVDMVRKGATGFRIGTNLETGDEPVRIGTYAEQGRRRVRINGAEATATTLGEWLSVSWLTPAMDGLFTGPTQDRRRYVDRLAFALDPTHAGHVTRYEAALRERNRLLSDRAEPDKRWFDAIEAQMAQAGAMVARGRSQLVDTLMKEIVAQDEAPFPRPALTLTSEGGRSVDGLSQTLHDNRKTDRAAQRTTQGPHRDDLEVLYAARRMPAALCSTGEQKALLIAITLAHAVLAAKGRASLLLLDEVAAHLDPDRRAALFARLRAAGAQVWITGTEEAPFEELRDAARWRIQGGEAKRL